MTAELVRAQPIAANLPDMVRYAEHLADANLLPAQYRQRPANVLYAMEYGRTLGITPIAAITGIHVIEGKPSASAALISGLVRQAGHKLRVTGNGLKATAQIIRSDDPDFTYEVTWELKRNQNGNPNAEDAKLLNKDVWQKYAAAMLKARAISQVARDACEEVLFGLHYTPEELNARVDADGIPMDATVQQLRPAPTSDDQWATPVPAPEAQAIADAAAKDARSKVDIKQQWATAASADVINAGITAPDTKEPEVLGAYLTRLAGTLPDVAADNADDGVIEGEVVTTTSSDDPAEIAEQALRQFATKAGLPNIDADFEAAKGLPLTEATADQIRGFLTELSGTAA